MSWSTFRGILYKILESIENKYHKRIVNVTFREKLKGWKNQCTNIYFEDGTIWTHKSLELYFYYFFVKDYSLRESCYSCEEYNTHISDITLADYWGTTNTDDKGVSLVFLNTEKGNDLFNLISPEIQKNIVSKEISEQIEIFNHNKYNHHNKERLIRIWRNKGFNYASTKFFEREFLKFRLQRRLKTIEYIIRKLFRVI